MDQAEIVRAIKDVLKKAEAAAAAPAAEQPTWLPIGKFASAYGYTARTVSRWVKLGMPHIGKGRNCRIDVARAQTWISSGGPTQAIRKLGADAHARALQ